jgi:hypothetical protein
MVRNSFGKTAKSYADAMPVRIRVAALDEHATAAELKAGEEEHNLMQSINQRPSPGQPVPQVSFFNYKKDPPQMVSCVYSTETPTQHQKAANKRWALLGRAASEARKEARVARKAVADYIADMETQALA